MSYWLPSEEEIQAMHERERWLWRNPKALASVRSGLEQSARGELVGIDLGSFAEYVDEDE